jgi:opacity protein-like surface antigen
MRKHSLKSVRLTAVIGLACLAATAGRVYAEGEGAFLNADVGASFITGLPSGVSADPGIRFSVVPGYRIYNDDIFSVSLQLESGMVWNSVNNSSRGDLYQVPFLAGIEYAFHTGIRLEPYIGVAGGGVYSDFNFSSPFDHSESSVNGAVQGMAGLRFRLTDSVELGVGYKFLATWPSNVDYLGTHSASVTCVIRF